MDVQAFLARIAASRHYRGQIVVTRVLDARPARYTTPKHPLPDELARLLQASGISQLYSHQAAALDVIEAGGDVVICTGTASGKSLCFHLPVLADLLDGGCHAQARHGNGSVLETDTAGLGHAAPDDVRALYLFPAKALAYDQLGGLQRLIEVGQAALRGETGGAQCGAIAALASRVRPACYDGDTPGHQRPGIRRHANILLSNPDMLHQSILPQHAKWAGFLARLKYVVLDEIHSYRGIFGSHVAGVVRRLLRICRHYGSRPQFICCSATLGNPRELAERLTGRAMTLIDEDGSPRGRRWFVLWNPPLEGTARRAVAHEPLDGTARRAVAHEPLDDTARRAVAREWDSPPFIGAHGPEAHAPPISGGLTFVRRSGNVEAQHLMQALMEAGAGTITFTKARVVAELIYKFVAESFERRRPDLARRVRPYRGGYLPNERREIERQLFSGELLGVCSTNALELGIDVGGLDAAIIVGFPSTLCSLWQQAGRAGRRQDESLAVFIAYDDPVDQYLMRFPDFVFDRPLEHAVIDPGNPHILAAQLGCAAFELPLGPDDFERFGPQADAVAATLAEVGTLRHTAGEYYWHESDFPAPATSLRTISRATFAIVERAGGKDEVIGQVDSISAPELVYPEAVYLHQGESYLVRKLDFEARLARVERLAADYYTQPVLADECRILAERLRDTCRGGLRCYGDVSVKWQTIAFQKFKIYTQEMIGQSMLDLPAQQIDTAGVWLQPPAAALEAVRGAGHALPEAFSGVRNLLTVVVPPLAMCDRYDIGGVVNSSQLGVTTIILYDRYPGGVGYARHGYECAADLLDMAARLAATCPCDNGCPACVGPPNLRVPIHHDPDLHAGYSIPSKSATRALLEAWG